MLMIIGDWENDKESFDKAEAQLIDTQKHHQIYGADSYDIIHIPRLFETIPFLDDRQKVDLLIYLLRDCDKVYMLKSWETNNDARLLHDYADVNGYKIIYSKKF